jgi:translation initiation factor IF-3
MSITGQDNYRVNRRIRVPQVRVIGPDGAQLGILATDDALRRAEEAGLDLVEVSPKAMPPVCKIMDYGKFKYENAKKTKEARKHQSVVTLKEVKFRPKTDDHDFDFKVKHIRRFLGEGNKSKLVVVFRGREIVHPETGHDVLKRVVEATQDIAQVEQSPMMDGRRMMMILAPRSGVIRPAGAPAMPATATPTTTTTTTTTAAAAPARPAPTPQPVKK